MDRMHYMPEDFLRDESYLRYYFRKDAGDIRFWEDWISRHPEKLDVIVAADQLIALLSLQLPEESFLREHERTVGAIRSSDIANQAGSSYIKSGSTQDLSAPQFLPKKRIYQWASAAVVVLIVLSTAILLTKPSVNPSAVIDGAGTASRQITNTSNSDKMFVLEDGSHVTLEKGAILTVPEHFLPGKREVWLVGNAFFDVSKNPNRPFYIFSNNIVTHVIGTSFFIRQDPVNRKLEVSVVTGKVEVYEKQPQETATGEKARISNGVILMPNQKVVYREDQRHFETSLTDNPVPVQREAIEGSAGKQLILVEHPIDFPVSLADLLPAINTQYGISIAVENENIYKCHFSGDLSGLGLYEKMDVICKSVGATYKIRGTQILIRGNGCPETK